MRRTQLYLEEEVWAALRFRARQSGSTISELVRQAVRERYAGQADQRKRAMLEFAGSRKNRTDIADSDSYIRELRQGRRLRRLSE